CRGAGCLARWPRRLAPKMGEVPPRRSPWCYPKPMNLENLTSLPPFETPRTLYSTADPSSGRPSASLLWRTSALLHSVVSETTVCETYNFRKIIMDKAFQGVINCKLYLRNARQNGGLGICTCFHTRPATDGAA